MGVLWSQGQRFLYEKGPQGSYCVPTELWRWKVVLVRGRLPNQMFNVGFYITTSRWSSTPFSSDRVDVSDPSQGSKKLLSAARAFSQMSGNRFKALLICNFLEGALSPAVRFAPTTLACLALQPSTSRSQSLVSLCHTFAEETDIISFVRRSMHLFSDAKTVFQSSLSFEMFKASRLRGPQCQGVGLQHLAAPTPKLSVSDPSKCCIETDERCFVRRSMYLLSDARKSFQSPLNFKIFPGEAPPNPRCKLRAYDAHIVGLSTFNISPSKLSVSVSSKCRRN